jgi:hypothetical protein
LADRTAVCPSEQKSNRVILQYIHLLTADEAGQ